MRELLARALGAATGYVELRLRRRWSTAVVFRKSRLEVATEYHAFGGVARCLVPGHGWGAVAFSDPERAVAAVQRAHELSLETRPDRPIELAPVPIRQVDQTDDLLDDPRLVALPDKRSLLEGLTGELLATDRRIVDSRTSYGDTVVETWLATSEGAWLHDLRGEASLGALAVAGEDGAQERALESVAARGGWGAVAGRESIFRDVAARAVARLHAPPITAGRYPVVLDPRATGALVLQTITNLCRSPARGLERELLPLGQRLGPECLSVGDDPTAPGLRTSLVLDDEGSPVNHTPLVRNGVVVGHLHTRETAARANAPATGNGLAPTLRSIPAARPTNSYVAKGQGEPADLIGEIPLGVYFADVLGVSVEGHQVTLSPASAWMIRDGKRAEMVKCAPLTADLFALYGRLERVAGDFAWDPSAATLHEAGPLRPITTGAPHTRFVDLDLGALHA
ncbi:MAG: TldD/PmbA family protein [Gemmatimonadales bacterium]|nr:TldD/PmbA family protein [Gemmatimonadales bacterium]